jgi:hypothetical protein
MSDDACGDKQVNVTVVQAMKILSLFSLKLPQSANQIPADYDGFFPAEQQPYLETQLQRHLAFS